MFLEMSFGTAPAGLYPARQNGGDEDNTFPEGTVTAEAAAFSVPVTVSFRPGRRRCEVRLKRRETKSIWIRI